jgi:uncharacterized membrane protein
MSQLETLSFKAIASGIEFVGALVIAFAVIQAFRHLRDPQQARLLVADGAIMGLSFKVAATLLKTIGLRSWNQIAMFAAILALRTVIKAEFGWQTKVHRQ